MKPLEPDLTPLEPDTRPVGSAAKPLEIDIAYVLESTGPLHVGTGHGVSGLHRTFLRDAHGQPYIPGSTVKGRARYAATRLCDWLDLPVASDAVDDVRDVRDPSAMEAERTGARGTDAASMRPVEAARLRLRLAARRLHQHRNNGPNVALPDVVSRIFGRAWERSTLRFSDARLETTADDGRGLREVRTGAARSRPLGTISQGRLFRSEVALSGLRFAGSIRGFLRCHPYTDPLEPSIELLVLWLSLQLMVLDGVGGDKSHGSGGLRWGAPLQMIVSGERFSPPGDGDLEVMWELIEGLRNEEHILNSEVRR